MLWQRWMTLIVFDWRCLSFPMTLIGLRRLVTISRCCSRWRTRLTTSISRTKLPSGRHVWPTLTSFCTISTRSSASGFTLSQYLVVELCQRRKAGFVEWTMTSGQKSVFAVRVKNNSEVCSSILEQLLAVNAWRRFGFYRFSQILKKFRRCQSPLETFWPSVSW